MESRGNVYQNLIFAAQKALDETGELPSREYPKLCVSDRAHAVFRYGQASKRPANIMAS